MHPFNLALIKRFAAEIGFDPVALVRYVQGERPVPDDLARYFFETLGVPKGAWARIAAPAPALIDGPVRSVAPPAVAISQAPVQDRKVHADHFYLLGMGSRRRDHAIFHWLLEQRRNTNWLAEQVVARVGRPLSRSALQTYIAGEQRSKRYGTRPVVMPLDVAQAIETITGGVVKVTDFSNVAKP